MKKGSVHIGTSGWHYKHWTGRFYPEGTKSNEQLAYYRQIFKTVEINNSFYRLPSPETFKGWAASVPDDFVFSVKGNRYVTHMKKLKVGKEDLQDFFKGIRKLGRKVGPVLFQLPPNWNVNSGRLADFLKLLPSGHRYTFEFRNHSWYEEEVSRLLQQYNCAFCIYELAGHLSPGKITADFIYVRLHGPGGKYQGNYDSSTLKKWADRCSEWQKKGKDIYVYFDNDQAGYAAFNAQKLAALTGI